MGANYYVIERRVKGKSWDMVATGLQDSVIADIKSLDAAKVSEPAVLWYDEYRAAGQAYEYRIKGVNVGGETPWSPVVVE